MRHRLFRFGGVLVALAMSTWPLVSLAGTNSLDWTYRLPAESFSSPALTASGSIIVGCGQGTLPNSAGLVSVNPNGQLNWRLALGPIMASPLIGSNDTIYVGSTLGTFYSLTSDGRTNWTLQTTNLGPSASSLSPSTSKLFSSATQARDGTIYVTAVEKGLYAIGPDGTTKWMFPLPAVVQFPFQISSPAVGADGTIYVGSADHHVYAVAPDGRERWESATGDSISGSPVLAEDGTILIGSDDGKLHAFNTDGTKRWEFDAGRIIESSCAIGAGGTIYVGSLNNKLFALTKDGQPLWTNVLSNPISSSPLVTSNGQIWVAALDGLTSLFDSTGTLAGVVRLGNSTFSSPVISTGPAPALYIASGNVLYRRGVTNGLATSPWPMFRRNPTHQARADQLGLAIRGANANSVQLSLLVETNRTYSLEHSEDLAGWKAAQEIHPTTPELLLDVPRAGEHDFYRLRQEPTASAQTGP